MVRRWPRVVVTGAVIAFKPGPFEDYTVVEPARNRRPAAVVDLLEDVSPIALAVAILGSIAVAVRPLPARRATSSASRSKWLALPGALVGVALIVAAIVETIVGDRRGRT